jgi:hypothetical protein
MMITLIMTRGMHVLPRALRAARGRLGASLGLGLGVALLALLVGAALAGCGQASIPTPTCGTVYMDHLGHVTNGAQAAQAETCFSQGFQQCHAVSLGLSQMTGTDTATESIFSVQTASGGSCRIGEADYDTVNTNTSATTTATCMGLSRQNGGLLITACSSGHDVSIPAPSPTPTPTSAPIRSPSP